jgi:transcriptional regulator with XRE-family HTH domain
MQAGFSAQPLYCDMAKGRPAFRPQPEMGAHLAQLRETAGFTQRQLAEKLGVPLSNITFWERSEKPPRTEILPKMAEALGVSVDALLRVGPVKPKNAVAKGRLQQVFERVSRLPRRQQQKVVEMAEGFLSLHNNGG